MGEAWDQAVEDLAEALFTEFGNYGGDIRWRSVVDAQKHRYRLMARAAVGYLAPAALEGRPVPPDLRPDLTLRRSPVETTEVSRVLELADRVQKAQRIAFDRTDPEVNDLWFGKSEALKDVLRWMDEIFQPDQAPTRDAQSDQAVRIATLKEALKGAEFIAGDLLGGYHDDHDFRHGMATICNFLRAKVGAAEGQVIDAGVTALLDHARKLWDAPDLSAYQAEGQWWVDLPGMTFPTARVGAGSEAAALKRAIDAHPNPPQDAANTVGQTDHVANREVVASIVETRPIIAAIQPGLEAAPLSCDCYGGCWRTHSKDWSRLIFANEDDAKFAWRRCHQTEELGVALPPDEAYPHGSCVLVDCELRFHSRELMWRHIRRLEVPALLKAEAESEDLGHSWFGTGSCTNEGCWARKGTDTALEPCPMTRKP